MKPGNLVKTKRASIGAPLGSVGLVIEKRCGVIDRAGEHWYIFTLLMVGCKSKQRSYCEKDLEVIS
jgi:hypothetical protein